MGRIFVVELEGRSYRCKFCKTHLALAEDLVSRAFNCRRGKAYLFNNAEAWWGWDSSTSCFNPYAFCSSMQSVRGTDGPALKTEHVLFTVNLIVGALEERLMLSGLHTVADIFCCCCGQIVGWKYEAAHERSQKYKEGKFVLERGRIVDEIDFATGFYIDARPSMSDAEDA